VPDQTVCRGNPAAPQDQGRGRSNDDEGPIAAGKVARSEASTAVAGTCLNEKGAAARPRHIYQFTSLAVSPGLAAVPVIDIRPHAVLLNAVAPLNLSFELIPFAGDLIKIAVGELAPLFLDPALDLLPVAFDAISVHRVVSSLLPKAERLWPTFVHAGFVEASARSQILSRFSGAGGTKAGPESFHKKGDSTWQTKSSPTV
jgi:hypothetical protein